MNWAIIIGIIVVLIIYWLSAKEFETIARMKGHQGYFWWCFFLGIVGWLMVVALPDQKTRGELLNSVQKLSKNGVYCLLTNNNCDFIKNLYKDYNIEFVPVKRIVNCDKNNRVGSEVIITNFKR